MGIDRITMPIVKVSCDVTEKLTSYIKALKTALALVETGKASNIDSETVRESNLKRIKQMTNLYDKLASSWSTKRNAALTQMIKPYHRCIVLDDPNLKYENDGDNSHSNRNELLNHLQIYISGIKTNEGLLEINQDEALLK